MGAWFSYLAGPTPPSARTCAPVLQDALNAPDDHDFTLSLDKLIQRHLQSESNEQQSNSRLILSLLEVIHVLQQQVDALGSSFKQECTALQPSSVASSGSAGYITLYRVFCDRDSHCHNGILYEDKPRLSSDLGWGAEEVLRGDRPIFNLETYLAKKASIHFVVFHECICVGNEVVHPSSSISRKSTKTISPRKQRILVVSRLLNQALMEVLRNNPYSPSPIENNARELDAPYSVLFHHQEELRELQKIDDGYETVLTSLLTFLESEHQKEFEDARRMFRDGLVTLSHVDKLYRINAVVVTCNPETKVLRAGVLTNLSWASHDTAHLRGWSWGYNGSQFARVPWMSIMQMPTSNSPKQRRAIPISELPVYPFCYAPQHQQEKLRNRGMQYWRARNRYYCEYIKYQDGIQSANPNPRHMIDVSAYYQWHEQVYSAHTVFDKKDRFLYDTEMERLPVLEHDHWPRSISAEDEQPDPDTLLMVPPTIFGHNMETKTWMSLHVDRLKKVDWDTESFRWLVMPQEHKEMLQALMRAASQSRSSNDETDFIRGKGQGLAILCHGAPGTGKSLSAECLAENARKPLYHVTCGEIGFSPQAVEKHLSKVMQQAERWDAILLLDEADIFLQRRSRENAEVNALVAVFLRALEYYGGTIVLTTNRVGAFDTAFMSRINVALYYEQLDRESRQQIWQNLLERYKRSSRRIMAGNLQEHLSELAEFQLNGRQIRNAFQTATGLAEYNESPLSYRHFLQTIKTVNEFEDYLRMSSNEIIFDRLPDAPENPQVQSGSDVIELSE